MDDSSFAEDHIPQGRRGFLRTVSIASLGGLDLLSITHEGLSATEKAGTTPRPHHRLDPEAELRVGMIGVYGHTGLVLNAIPDIQGARLVAYAWQDAERTHQEMQGANYANDLKASIEQIKRHRVFRPETKVFDTYQEMLSSVQLDVVGVCLPYTINVFASIAAAEKGIHVMSEKPLATDLEELKRLEEVIRRTGVQISAMLDMRLSPEIRTIRDVVSKGAIGEPILANAQKSYKFGNQRPWFYKKHESYGGTIPWIGIHVIDFIIYTTGLSITQVAAMQSNKSLLDFPGTEDNAGILLKLSNGGTAVITLDYLRPETAASHGDDRFRLVGSKGIVETRAGKVELISQDHPAKELPLMSGGSIFADFVAHLRGQTQHVMTPDEVIAVNRICLLARQAADQGKVLSV